MITSIPWLQPSLNFFLNEIWFVNAVPKYLIVAVYTDKKVLLKMGEFVAPKHVEQIQIDQYSDQ